MLIMDDMKPQTRPTVEVNPAFENSDEFLRERAKIAHDLHEGEKTEASITILKPIPDVFEFWRDFKNLPKFMRHVEKLEVLSPVRSHWVVQTLGGLRYEWDAEIIAEIPDRMISWQTLPGSELNQAGSVWFRPAPQDGATEIHVHLRFQLKMGRAAQAVGRRVAEVFGEEPSQILKEDLRYLRWLMEAGEAPTTEGQSHGARGILH
jgi:uncharacterized membrane protein